MKNLRYTAEDIAYIFTYEKAWQKHLEGKLGLKPVMDISVSTTSARIH